MRAWAFSDLSVSINPFVYFLIFSYSELILGLLQWAVRIYYNQPTSFFTDHCGTTLQSDVDTDLSRILSLLHGESVYLIMLLFDQ